MLECSQGCYVVKIWPGYLNLWPMRQWNWKSTGFHIILSAKYIPNVVKIHWRMLILECSQGCYACDIDIWPWKSIGFQILLRTKYVPSLVKIHWRMLILECSQRYYVVNIWPCYPDLWPIRLWTWKSIGFRIILRVKYVSSVVKIHWRMLILECSQGYYVVIIWACDLDLWSWKSIGFQDLLRTKYVPSLVKIHWRMLIIECSQGCNVVTIWNCDLDLWSWKSIGFPGSFMD